MELQRHLGLVTNWNKTKRYKVRRNWKGSGVDGMELGYIGIKYKLDITGKVLMGTGIDIEGGMKMAK